MPTLELTDVEADALDALLSAEVADGYLYHSKTRIAAWYSTRIKLRAAQEAADAS